MPNNELLRLLKNLKTLIEIGVLESEFKVFAVENPELDSLTELNEIIESELSYWEE